MNKLFIFLFTLFISINISSASTAVSGQIRTNTTWTKAGSPYICTGTIEVDSYSVLTIEPGTIIDLDFDIKSYNSIIFQYNTTDTTVVKSHHPGVEPYIEIINPNYTNPIIFKRIKFISSGINLKWQQSSILIEECSFYKSRVQWRATGIGSQTYTFRKNNCFATALYLGNSAGSSSATAVDRVIIDSNSFDSMNVQIPISGEVFLNKTFEITNNVFKNINTNVIGITTGEQIISGNIFYKVRNALIHYPCPSPVRILSNIFVENDVALMLNDIGDTVEIRNNSFYDNNIGVSVYYFPAVSWAVDPLTYINPPIIHNNCFYSNKMAGFAWNAKNSISIGANWWGTIDTNKIDSAIIDNKYDFRIGYVNYKPNYLLSNPGCNTYTPPTKVISHAISSGDISVFPNPTSNSITFKTGTRIKTLIIYNIVGKIVYKSIPLNNITTVNIEGNPTGIYSYSIITDDDNIHYGKIIKE